MNNLENLLVFSKTLSDLKIKTSLMNKKDLSQELKEKALKEGFAVVGIASIPGSSRIKLRTKALERWLENNYHSEMKWMESNKRKRIELMLNDAKSVITVGYNYLNENSQNKFLKIAKFGHGEDYHKVIKQKLSNIGNWLEKKLPNCKWKICIDSSPLLEKAWAEESGIGWIGKHSNVINRNHGSWLSLGFIIVNKELTPDEPAKSLCGKCEKCIEECPTKAITEPFVVNSNLCIAYHTIENRNTTFPSHIKQKLNGWVAGCDICQDVCPWNNYAPINNDKEAKTQEWIKDLDANSISWTDEEWTEKLKESTLKRIKPWMWRRNIKAVIKT